MPQHSQRVDAVGIHIYLVDKSLFGGEDQHSRLLDPLLYSPSNQISQADFPLGEEYTNCLTLVV